MLRRIQLAAVAVCILLLAAAHLAPIAGQTSEPEIRARARVFPDVGPGLIGIKRDAAGRYYVAASPATKVLVLSADGKSVGEIPGAAAQEPTPPDPKKNPKIVFAADFDVDSSGHVLVADRGANNVKIFAADGSLAGVIPIPAPTSVAALPGSEFAVTSLRYRWLMGIYAYAGTLVRAIGDPGDFAHGADALHTSDLGRVSSDPTGNLYYVFLFLPEPVVRRFDRFGFAGTEIALDEFAPVAPHHDPFSDSNDNPRPVRMQIGALAVDSATQEIWIAIGNELRRFDKNGVPIGSYRTLSPAGAPLSAKTILVEPDRLLLGTEAWGIFDFAKPAKASANSSVH
ncbi:MAG: hypothetical protein WCC03_02440 [Candidatus Acidiferrales bacterium]